MTWFCVELHQGKTTVRLSAFGKKGHETTCVEHC
jgi:hypothetical protein